MTAARSATTTTAARAIIERLERHCVRHVFGIPGTHNVPLYDALARSAIAHVTPRHEQGAGYAADGYARAGRAPGVCLVTSGPGVTNILTAIATAHADSVPLLVIAPGMPEAIAGGDSGFLHELPDQHGLVERAGAHSVRAHSVSQALAVIDEAFATFAIARPRPFYLEIPLELLDAEASAARPGLLSPLVRPSPAPDAVAAGAALLAAASRPALVLGGGAKDAGGEALAVARRLAAPVVTTVNGKGAIPERDPLSLGASIRLRNAQEFLRTRDVVLVVGSELGESDLWRAPPLELNGMVIRIDIDAAQLQKNARAEVAIRADARQALTALLTRLGPIHGDVDVNLPQLAAVRGRIRREALADGARYAPLIAALADALNEKAIVASDSTMACYYGLVHFLAQAHPRQLLYPTGYATLGYGLPAAIGAKLACPGRQVLALLGDGGAMFTIAELATAVDLGLPIPIVIVCNGGYGEIRRGMLARGMAPIAVDFEPPDFAALARAFGAHGVTASTYATAAARVTQALGAQRPTVIAVQEEPA